MDSLRRWGCQMIELLLGIAILTCIVLNSRREAWKHTAKMRQHQINDLRTILQSERDANDALVRKMPGYTISRHTGNEWPEDIDA